ncbi:unnamed protein product [Symbiodinium pilosum]|uniref:Uncharacterized protein n=1 Tax=Symbiodinium pilosum TaxID=2952 RepID=A0A812LBT7_SYMPI|nr:unnamed protein product [Symbiodinium pilosum]
MVASPRAEARPEDWTAALEEILEEIRLSIFKDSATDLLDGDPRLQTIFERFSEKLTEPPGEGGKELSEAKLAQRRAATLQLAFKIRKANVALCGF